jgi:symplekin
MASMIRDFALQLLRRLQSRPKAEKAEEPVMNAEGENMEDGQLPQEDIIQTSYLPEQLDLPAQSDQILQHLELLFALSTKVPEFLDEYVTFLLKLTALTGN